MATVFPPTTSKRAKRKMVREATEAMPVTIAQIAESMKRNRGSAARVAEDLKQPVEVIRRKIRLTPQLQMVRQNILEERLDKAEEKLDEQVENGNISAITFTLANLGKSRGYGKGEDIDVNVSVNHSAGLIKRLKATVSTPEEWDENEIVEVDDYEWVSEDSNAS